MPYKQAIVSEMQAPPMTDWKAAQQKAAKTARWAVTMTKCRIRKLIAKTTWNLITFCGKKGGESVGIVDLVAIRKDHGIGVYGLKRGDVFEIILIQVKGGGVFVYRTALASGSWSFHFEGGETFQTIQEALGAIFEDGWSWVCLSPITIHPDYRVAVRHLVLEILRALPVHRRKWK